MEKEYYIFRQIKVFLQASFMKVFLREKVGTFIMTEVIFKDCLKTALLKVKESM